MNVSRPNKCDRRCCPAGQPGRRPLSGLVRQAMRRIFGGRPRPLQPGTIFRDIDELWCPELAVIPPGEFMMGSTEAEKERPQHRVQIAYPLAVGRYPVTFEECDHFARIAGREPPRDEGTGPRPQASD